MGDSPAAAAASPSWNPLRRFYAWILSWAHHPMGTWALAIFAFVDSSFFPIPPLFLQVAMSLERPKKSFWYAFVDTAGSVAGAVLGFYVGYALYESVGQWVIQVNRLEPQFNKIGDYFGQNAFAFILIYSFIPFPYKVITIGSGVYHDQVSLPTLLVASTIGRSIRFFSLGAMCYFMGPGVKTFIDKYFNLVCLGIGAFVIAVLLAMKLGLK